MTRQHFGGVLASRPHSNSVQRKYSENLQNLGDFANEHAGRICSLPLSARGDNFRFYALQNLSNVTLTDRVPSQLTRKHRHTHTSLAAKALT
jgi:hypothetical protein